MIKFEHNTLVLDPSHTKEDQKAVNDFVNYVLEKQRNEIEKEADSYRYGITAKLS